MFFFPEVITTDKNAIVNDNRHAAGNVMFISLIMMVNRSIISKGRVGNIPYHFGTSGGGLITMFSEISCAVLYFLSIYFANKQYETAIITE